METIVTAGGRVLAIEADKTIVIDEPEVVEYANRNKLAIVAIRSAESGLEAESPADTEAA